MQDQPQPRLRLLYCVLKDQGPGQIAGAGQAHEVQDVGNVLRPIVLEHGRCVVLKNANNKYNINCISKYKPYIAMFFYIAIDDRYQPGFNVMQNGYRFLGKDLGILGLQQRHGIDDQRGPEAKL